MKDIKIIVAAHKKYDMPDNNLYLPVFVGADGKEDISGYKRDDTGSNISIKNPNFCELTGLILGLEKCRRRLYRISAL